MIIIGISTFLIPNNKIAYNGLVIQNSQKQNRKILMNLKVDLMSTCKKFSYNSLNILLLLALG